jgi:hypothetical protein
MRVNEKGEICLTEAEARDIHAYIRSSLSREWDNYSSHVICTDGHEAGMRRMNPEMYDFAEQLEKII